MRRTEREVFTYDIAVRSRSKLAVPPPLEEVLVALSTSVANNLALIERDRGSLIYRIGEIRMDHATQTATLLIRRGDTNASNAVYSDRRTGASRVAERRDDEVGDRAAHLVVSMTPEVARPGRYLAHLEGVPGIGHRVVQSLLNKAIRNAIIGHHASFTYDDPAGARDRQGNLKTHAFQPLIELLGHPKDSLIQDLEQGTVSEITLIDGRPKGLLGGNQYLDEKEHRIKVSVSGGLPQNNRLASLLAAAQTRRASYQTAAIRFKDPAGHNRTIRFDLDTGNPEQQQYIASYDVVGIAPPMDDSSDTIVDRFADRMKERVVHDRS